MIHQDRKGSVSVIECTQTIRDPHHTIGCDAIGLQVDRIADRQDGFRDDPRLTADDVRGLRTARTLDRVRQHRWNGGQCKRSDKQHTRNSFLRELHTTLLQMICGLITRILQVLLEQLFKRQLTFE
jgi:hypothetical protein